MDGVRTSLCQAGMNVKCWDEAVTHWEMNWNHSTKQVRTGKVPVEIAEQVIPSLFPRTAALVPFGCLAVHKKEAEKEYYSKVDTQGRDCVIIGYSENGSYRVRPIEDDGNSIWNRIPHTQQEI